MSRVNVLTAIRTIDDQGEHNHPVDLTRDLEHIEAAIRRTPDCRLVIIDPISAYLGGTDSHRNAEIRGLLASLADMASRHGIAVLAVTHLRKGDGPAIYRSMGSLAFVAAARTVWAVVADKEDSARRLFLPVKNNLAQDQNGLAYRIQMGPMGPRVVFDPDAVAVSVNEALGFQTDNEVSAVDEAVQWLLNSLAAGPRPAKGVKDAAKKDGISLRTLDRAKSKSGVIAAPDAFGGPWMWQLPNSPQCANIE